MGDEQFIGIDFGTSYSTVCWWNPRSNVPEVIRNEHGEEKTPSAVYIGSGGEILVGKPALDQLADIAHMPSKDQAEVFARTFVGVKRMLKDNLPLALPDGRVASPVEIAAEILKNLKKSAEIGCLHDTVDGAVVAHPVLFTAREKERLQEAAALAGFKKIILVEEPVAAVMGYVASGADAGGKILVYDLGGGTLDLAFVENSDGFHIPAEPMGSPIGGEDFDRLIYDQFNLQMERKHGIGFGIEPGAVNLHVLMECRRLKEKLSSLPKGKLSYVNLDSNLHVSFDLTRTEYEALILDLVRRTVDLTVSLLERLKRENRNPETVVLVGGPTRTPLIQAELKKILPVSPMATMHADVAVAMGAAFVAKDRLCDPARYAILEAPRPVMTWLEAIDAGDVGQMRLHLATGQDLNALDDKGMTALGRAVKNGDRHLVEFCLHRGADIEKAEYSEQRPLFLAVGRGDDVILQSLLNANAKLIDGYMRNTPLGEAVCHHTHLTPLLVKAHSDHDLPPLQKAIILNDEATVFDLLDADADVDAVDAHGDHPLHWACRIGNNRVVGELLLRKSDIKARGRFAKTPLILGSQYGFGSIVRMLLEAGAEIEAKDDVQCTPLHWASQNGHEKVVKVLLEAGAVIEAKAKNQLTPIHVAAVRGHEKVVKALLEAGAEIEAQDQWQYTPLHRAAVNGHEKVVKVLLEAGAEIEAKDNVQCTPLHRAAVNGHVPAIQALLEAGAEIEAQDQWQYTPLHRAAENGHEKVVKALLEAGAEIEAQDQWQYTPLHRAAENGHVPAIQALLEAGAEIEVKDEEQCTPLHLASKQGRVSAIHALLEAGAEIEAQDKNQCTPLHRAAENGHVPAIQALLEAGAKIEAKNINRWTPVDFAAYNGHEDLARELLNAGARFETSSKNLFLHWASENGLINGARALLALGAEINSQDEDNKTPLHLAAENNQDEIVALLLSEECGVDCRDKEGKTPLHYAAECGHESVVYRLLSWDPAADIEACDDVGNRPIHLAAMGGHEPVVKALLKAKACVDLENNRGDKPIMLAAKNGHLSLVRLLFPKKIEVKTLFKVLECVPDGSKKDPKFKDLWAGLAESEWKAAAKLATTYASKYQFDDAIDALECFLEKYPDVPQAKEALALQKSLHDRKNLWVWENAEKDAERARYGASYKQAADVYQAFIKSDPSHPQADIARSRIRELEGLHHRQQDDMRWEAVRVKAEAEIKAGSYEKAVPIIREYLGAHPQSNHRVKAHFILWEATRKNAEKAYCDNQYEKGITVLQEYIKANPASQHLSAASQLESTWTDVATKSLNKLRAAACIGLEHRNLKEVQRIIALAKHQAPSRNMFEPIERDLDAIKKEISTHVQCAAKEYSLCNYAVAYGHSEIACALDCSDDSLIELRKKYKDANDRDVAFRRQVRVVSLWALGIFIVAFIGGVALWGYNYLQFRKAIADRDLLAASSRARYVPDMLAKKSVGSLRELKDLQTKGVNLRDVLELYDAQRIMPGKWNEMNAAMQAADREVFLPQAILATSNVLAQLGDMYKQATIIAPQYKVMLATLNTAQNMMAKISSHGMRQHLQAEIATYEKALAKLKSEAATTFQYSQTSKQIEEWMVDASTLMKSLQRLSEASSMAAARRENARTNHVPRLLPRGWDSVELKRDNISRSATLIEALQGYEALANEYTELVQRSGTIRQTEVEVASLHAEVGNIIIMLTSHPVAPHASQDIGTLQAQFSADPGTNAPPTMLYDSKKALLIIRDDSRRLLVAMNEAETKHRIYLQKYSAMNIEREELSRELPDMLAEVERKAASLKSINILTEYISAIDDICSDIDAIIDALDGKRRGT